MTNIQATSITQIAYILSIKEHFPNRIASAHSSFFLPIASPSIILVDSLIFGYLFTNLSSTRSLCQRAVIYLTMLLYEKNHKFYWLFHQYLCTFFMYSLQFFIYRNEVFKIISFSFQHDIFLSIYTFSAIVLFHILKSFIHILHFCESYTFSSSSFMQSSPCTFPPCSSLQIMLQFLNKW